MSVGAGGVEYENKVLRVIKREISGVPSIQIKEGTSTAAFAANEPDLQLLLHGKQINIEIKQDKKAQMGGGSFNYDGKKFFSSEPGKIDPTIEQAIVQILNGKKKDLDKLLKYAKSVEMPALASTITGLPLRLTKDTWDDLTKQRLLVPLNAKIATDINFLYEHYAKKNCFYIQLGGSGLYYLKSNPLNLPVPQLTSNFDVELRLARSGSSFVSKYNAKIASGNIRAQGRLGGSLSNSPFSLDREGDLMKTFGTVTKKQAEKLL